MKKIRMMTSGLIAAIAAIYLTTVSAGIVSAADMTGESSAPAAGQETSETTATTETTAEQDNPETQSASAKCWQEVYDAFAAGAQTVDVYILFWARSEHEIRAWATSQADEYILPLLDDPAYTDEEIGSIREAYYTRIYEEAYNARSTDRANEILALAGIRAEDAVCDHEAHWISCSVTQEQIKAIENLDYLRRIMLKSTWEKLQRIENGEVNISDPDVMREMLTAFIAENNLDAAVVSNEKYPGYEPIVIEYNAGKAFDDTPNYYAPILDYMIETGMDRSQIGVVPIENGVPILTSPASGQETSGTTETTETAETTAEEPTSETLVLSDETLCEWAAKDYSDKHQKAVTAAVTAKEDGKVTITLTDAAGKEADTYVLDAESGIGANADGEEINLPQTGNNSISNYLLALTAVFLVGGGVVMLVTSGMIRRKKENE